MSIQAGHHDKQGEISSVGERFGDLRSQKVSSPLMHRTVAQIVHNSRALVEASQQLDPRRLIVHLSPVDLLDRSLLGEQGSQFFSGRDEVDLLVLIRHQKHTPRADHPLVAEDLREHQIRFFGCASRNPSHRHLRQTVSIRVRQTVV